MKQNPDLLIVGGGIIGLSCAYEAAKLGLKILILERAERALEASWAGAGILPPGNSSQAATPIDKLRAVGSELFPIISRQLFEETGIDNGYLRSGGIEYLTPKDAYAVDIWQREGIRVEKLTTENLGVLEPTLRQPAGTTAYYLPDTAQVRNPWHLRALTAGCRAHGVSIQPETTVSEVLTSAGKVVGVKSSNGEQIHAGQTVISSGAWTGRLLQPLGIDLPISPVLGQIVLYRAEKPLFRPILMFGKRYLVPRSDGRILVGSTEEPEAGFDKRNTREGIEQLKEFASDLVPELATTPVETQWAGLRPASPNGLPYIGPIPGYSHGYVAAGHFRAGVQLSLGTAKLVRQLLEGKPAQEDTEWFRLDRDKNFLYRSAFRS